MAIVDHVDLGPSFDAADYSYSGGTLFTRPDLGYKTLDVTSRVRSNVAAVSPCARDGEKPMIYRLLANRR